MVMKKKRKKAFSKPRGCPIRKFTNILPHTTKMINPRVKSQARGQNNRSRALKWGIVHLCSWITFRDRDWYKKLDWLKISPLLKNPQFFANPYETLLKWLGHE